MTMRPPLATIALALLAGAAAHAGPAGADPAAVERWVGTWSGKATFKGCPVKGSAQVALPVTATAAGALRSDGDALVEGLGDLEWAAAATTLTLAHGGYTGSIKLAKGKATLELTTTGGCVVKATLTRASSGIAACDAVRALATAKAACASLPEATRGDDLADVEASWKGWATLSGKAKKAQGTRCEARRDALRTEVAACAGASWGTGIAACDQYVATLERYLVCDKVPQGARDAARQGLDAMKHGWSNLEELPEDARQMANEACRHAVEALRESIQAVGCPL